MIQISIANIQQAPPHPISIPTLMHNVETLTQTIHAHLHDMRINYSMIPSYYSDVNCTDPMLIYNELTRDVDYAIKHSTDTVEENDVDSRVGGSSLAQVRLQGVRVESILNKTNLTA